MVSSSCPRSFSTNPRRLTIAPWHKIVAARPIDGDDGSDHKTPQKRFKLNSSQRLAQAIRNPRSPKNPSAHQAQKDRHHGPFPAFELFREGGPGSIPISVNDDRAFFLPIKSMMDDRYARRFVNGVTFQQCPESQIEIFG